MNLYKMYLIQAGMVFFPIFFVCMLAKRRRVEEVQMVLHHRHHHSLQHPEEKSIRLSEAVAILRKSQATRLTVNNDFPQFVQILKNAETDVNVQVRMTQQFDHFEQNHLSA